MVDTILIATIHHDPSGSQRLEKMLNHFKPENICLEATPKSATKMMNDHEEKLRSLNCLPEKLKESDAYRKMRLLTLASKYEVWVPKQYKQQHSEVTLFCIDREAEAELNQRMKIASRRYAQMHPYHSAYKSLSSLVNIITKDLNQGYQKKIDEQYLLDGNFPQLVKIYGIDLANEISYERDKNFAKQIITLREKNPQKTIVAVLGIGHIFGSQQNNTYDLLRELNPKRYKLIEADNLK